MLVPCFYPLVGKRGWHLPWWQWQLAMGTSAWPGQASPQVQTTCASAEVSCTSQVKASEATARSPAKSPEQASKKAGSSSAPEANGHFDPIHCRHTTELATHMATSAETDWEGPFSAAT